MSCGICFQGLLPAGSTESTDSDGLEDFAAPADKAGFLEFPADFVWGAASAAYQIEGAAAEGGRQPSVWDDLTHYFSPLVQTGDVACDHYHRFRDDIALMARLGLKAYSFSISWSRLIPEGEGDVNKEGAQFYSDLIGALIEHGITPWVTLFHWDFPSALNSEFGGLLGSSERVTKAFEAYARVCFERFGDRVKHWITLNEPWVVCAFHMPGIWLPGLKWPKRSWGGAFDPYTVGHNLLLSHAWAAHTYHSEFQAAQGGKIGMSLNTDFAMPFHQVSPREKEAAQRARDFQLGWFADPVYFGDYPRSMREACGERLPDFRSEDVAVLKDSCDFFGINNYFSVHASPAPAFQGANIAWKLASRMFTPEGAYYADRGVSIWQDPAWEKITTGTGWPIVPWGLRDLLLYIQDRYSPRGGIAVTENGCSYEEDSSKRMDSEVGALERAAAVRGVEACRGSEGGVGQGDLGRSAAASVVSGPPQRGARGEGARGGCPRLLCVVFAR